MSASRRRSASGFHGLRSPFRVLPFRRRRSLVRPRQPSWDCSPLQRPQRGRSTDPGYPAPVRSVFRVSTLLTVSSLPSLPVRGTGAAHGVRPAERFPSVEPHAFRRRCPPAVFGIAHSCSEDQEFTMPRSFRALLPTEIRTLHGPRSAQADALMGDFASPERSPRGTHPASRALPSCTFPSPATGVGGGGAPGTWHTRGQVSPSRDPPALLRFSTRTCPRFSR
jgi:hypothetical protein